MQYKLLNQYYFVIFKSSTVCFHTQSCYLIYCLLYYGKRNFPKYLRKSYHL